MSKARIIHELHDDFGVTISEAEKAYDIAVEYIRLRSAIGDHPEDYEPSEYVLVKASAEPETYKEKLKEIADELSEKFAYLNTCPNERDIILGYLGVKRPRGIHCDTDCTNTKCECNHHYTKSPSAEPDWIPCSKRLPEEVGLYLVTLDYKEHGKCVTALWYHGKQIGWDLRVADVVVAWMPLPIPWKGEENE